jgi:hypothetical protein
MKQAREAREEQAVESARNAVGGTKARVEPRQKVDSCADVAMGKETSGKEPGAREIGCSGGLIAVTYSEEETSA